MCGGADRSVDRQPFDGGDQRLFRLAPVKVGINTLSHNLRKLDAFAPLCLHIDEASKSNPMQNGWSGRMHMAGQSCAITRHECILLRPPLRA